MANTQTLANNWFEKLSDERKEEIILQAFQNEMNSITTKFKIDDRAYKPKGYQFPCTIVSVFKTISGETRIVGEMDGYGMLHIFNESQLEHLTECCAN
jgi:hypothetical protein